jgi:TolB protein
MSNVKILALLISVASGCFGDSVELFDGHEDVGTVMHPGSVAFDPSTRSYTVTGSGENMWSTADAFHFVWKKVSGDFMLTADISFPTKTGDAHKKAVLMIRQSLDAGSAYADAALHGNGLMSLQARDQAGAATHEIQANVTGPRRLRIEKRGAYLYMSVGGAGQEPSFSGGSMRVALEEPFYIGIGVCAHNKDVEEQAVFSNVELKESTKGPDKLYSTIETITVSSTDRRVTAVLPERLAAPSWSHDGSIFFERGMGIWRVPAEGGEPQQPMALVADSYCLSPDGTTLAFSNQGGVVIVPIAGGRSHTIAGKRVALHGFSPDGATILATSVLGIFTAPVAGVEYTLIPAGSGHNDNPQFTPDAKSLYFNSDRSGTTQIWRMLADGSEQEQLTADGMNNGFPHVSPDGRRLVFLSWEGGRESPKDTDLLLRMLSIADRKINVLAKLRGGGGMLGAAPWSPDGRRVALISSQERP